MDIEKLKKRYYEQDNAITSTPFIVEVQEQRSIGVMEDGYSCRGSYDTENRVEYSYDAGAEDTFDSFQECLADALESVWDDDERSKADQEAQDIIAQCSKDSLSREGLEDLIIERIEEYMDIEIKRYNVGYIWYPVTFCFTLKGAHEYMRANKHNHGKLRTFIVHVYQRNYELTEVMEHLELKNKADEMR